MATPKYVELAANEIPLGRALPFSIFDKAGTLLVPRGHQVASLEAHERLMNLGPHREYVEAESGKPAAPGAHPGQPAQAKPADKGDGVDVLPDVRHNVEYVQLIFTFPGEIAKQTVAAQFFGKLGVSGLMISAPPLPGSKTWAHYVGLEVTMRMTSSRKVYQFETSIVSAHTAPVPHLLLRYPETTRQGVFRKAVRLDTNLPAKAKMADGSEVDVVIKDISGAGCAIEAAAPVGEVGQSLELVFEAKMTDVTEMLTVPVVLRNLPKGHVSGPVRRGLSFGDGANALDTRLRLTLKAFICESVLEGDTAAPSAAAAAAAIVA